MAKPKNTKGTRQQNRSSNPKPSKPRKTKDASQHETSAQQGGKDSGAKSAAKAGAKTESGSKTGYTAFKDRRGAKVVIIIVAVILAAGMTIPSVAVMLSHAGDDTQGSEAATEARSTVPDASWSVDDTNSYYQNLVSQTQDRLEGDPNNVTLLRSMGNNYSSWATTLQNSHADDEDAQQQAREHFADAATYYQRFLDQQDSDPVALNLAQATYGSGDVDGAIAQLQALTEKSPDYAQAWQQLSAIYQLQGNQEAATEASARASEASSAASTASAATTAAE